VSGSRPPRSARPLRGEGEGIGREPWREDLGGAGGVRLVKVGEGGGIAGGRGGVGGG